MASDLDPLELIRSLRLPDERPFEDAMAEFQREDFAAMLDPGGPPNVWLSRPRGGSKTADLAALAIADMLTGPPRAVLIGIAVDLDQAKLMNESIESWIAASPELAGSFVISRDAVVNQATGTKFRAVASDAPDAYGSRPWRIYIDEITSHPNRAMFDALVTAAHKVAGARLFIASTAGSPNHWTWDVWRHAHESDMWQVHEHHALAPWTDAAQIADMRKHLPASVVARQLENRWAAGEESLLTPEEVDGATDHDREPSMHGDGTRRHVIALDVGLKHDRTAIVVVRIGKTAHRVERVITMSGTKEAPVQLGVVEDKLRELLRLYRPATVVADPYQAVGIVQRLGAHQAREYPFTSQSVASLSSKLLSLVREGRLRLLPDPRIRSELLSLVVRETSYGWRMEAAPGAHDDVAMALAVAALVADEPQPGASVFYLA